MAIKIHAGHPSLHAAAEAATVHFDRVGFTVESARAFRENARDAGLAVRRIARGVLVLVFVERAS